MAKTHKQAEKIIRCYLATNQEKYRTAYLLNQMGFGRQFDGIFSSAYVGYMKHDTAFFEHVLRELKNVKAQEMLFGMTSQGIRVSGHLDLCSSILELEAILTLRRTVPPLLS